ncbi:hypothetical protein [Pseudomonas sp. H9]|uniref:hypothetical protein n=1 Tax=Pseudomonas sp. H9 TaxID=483968 RepID=UPI002115039D|nr:hypothetical protein [Pseudomonas sp. H9]
MNNAEPKSPLTIIAIFAGIIEASALASLPFLSEDSQNTYTWFLVGFPFFLTVLFFLTLNFNYKSLYSPPATEAKALTIAPTSPSLPAEVETSTHNEVQAPAPIETFNEVIKPPVVTGNTSDQPLAKPIQAVNSTVTITAKGTSASQLLEHFAVHALNQHQPLCNTLILDNVETGTRTILASEPINR